MALRQANCVGVVCLFGNVRAIAPFQGYFAAAFGVVCLAAFWHFIVSLARIERKKLNG